MTIGNVRITESMFDDFLPASSLSGFIAGTFLSGRHKDCVPGEIMIIMLIMMLIDAYDDYCDYIMLVVRLMLLVINNDNVDGGNYDL